MHEFLPGLGLRFDPVERTNDQAAVIRFFEPWTLPLRRLLLLDGPMVVPEDLEEIASRSHVLELARDVVEVVHE